jgi:hypothetical protein
LEAVVERVWMEAIEAVMFSPAAVRTAGTWRRC